VIASGLRCQLMLGLPLRAGPVMTVSRPSMFDPMIFATRVSTCFLVL
jgi:hypothetical protein